MLFRRYTSYQAAGSYQSAFSGAMMINPNAYGLVDATSNWIYRTAIWFRNAETGLVRQYVMFIVVGTVAMFVLISFYLNYALAG